MRNGEGYEDPTFTRAWQHTPEYKAIREQKEIAIMNSHVGTVIILRNVANVGIRRWRMINNG